MEKTPTFTVKFKEQDDGYTELEIGTPELDDGAVLAEYVEHLKMIIDLVIAKDHTVRTANDLISLQPSNKMNHLYLEDLDSLSMKYDSSGSYIMEIVKGTVVRTFAVSAPVKYVNTTDNGYEVYSDLDPVLQSIRR